MKLVHLTPGTGNFYCGSCLRDHGLIVGLQRRGHDVLMVPLYLPLVLEDGDAPGVVKGPVFFGGVNVYLQHKLALFRHTPRWVDRAFDAAGLLRLAARSASMTSARDLGELTLSMLRGESGRQTKELHRLLAWLRTSGRPDVICLSNVLLAGLARPLREALGAPVVVTLQGEDAFLDSLPEPYREQAWELLRGCCREVAAFQAVSHYYGEVMTRRLALPPERVRVVHNGVDTSLLRPPAQRPAQPVIGYLARLHHGKGLGTLIEAFVMLRQRGRVPGVRLHIGGSQTPSDLRFVRRLQTRLAEAGAAGDCTWFPNLTLAQKVALLQGLSVLSVPATYGEPFGLYVVEALACGVPVVQPRHAAFPELLDATGGGLLVEPNDAEALAAGLEALLLDPARATALGQAGRAAVERKFSLDHLVAGTEELLSSVAKR